MSKTRHIELGMLALVVVLLSGCIEFPDEYTAARDRVVMALRKKDYAEARECAQLAVEASGRVEGPRGCYEQIESRNNQYFIDLMNADVSNCLLHAKSGVNIYNAYKGPKDIRIHLVGAGAMNAAGNTLNYLGRFADATNHLYRARQVLAELREKVSRDASMLPTFWELDVKVWRNLSFSLMGLGQTNEALSSAKEAVSAAAKSSIKQHSLTARRQLALLTAVAGDHGEAVKALNADTDGSAFVRFMRSDQQKDLVLYNTISRAIVAFRCGDYETAATTMQEAMKMPEFQEEEKRAAPAMWACYGVTGIALRRTGHGGVADSHLIKAKDLLSQLHVPSESLDIFFTQGGDGWLHPVDVLNALSHETAPKGTTGPNQGIQPTK